MVAPPSRPTSLKQVQDLPSVDAAAGSLIDLQSNSNPAKLLDHDGEIIGRQGETMGVGIDDAGRQFSPLKLKQGEWADGDGEIVLDAGTASQARLQGRRQVRAAGSGALKAYTLTGMATFGSVDSLGGTTLAIFDVPTAQALFAKKGQYDSISVKAKDGVSPEALTKEIKPLLAAEPRGQDRRRPGRGRRQGRQREPEVHHLLPARLRRHRAVRGRVRDPQHALDHRRPALA